MKPHKYSIDALDRALAMRGDGELFSVITAETGLPQDIIIYHCQRTGIPPSKIIPAGHRPDFTDKNGRSCRGITRAEDQRIMDLDSQGLRAPEIARQIKRPTNTVRYRLRRAALIAENPQLSQN